MACFIKKKEGEKTRDFFAQVHGNDACRVEFFGGKATDTPHTNNGSSEAQRENQRFMT